MRRRRPRVGAGTIPAFPPNPVRSAPPDPKPPFLWYTWPP